MAKKQQDKPKIIVDDDWKKEAQAEKERLDEQVEKKAAEGPAAGAPGQPRELPPASFTTLVSSLATQAMLSLGGLQDPKSKKILVDLDMAEHHIDTLKVMQEKTSGNLTDEEKKILDEALYHTRMLYVQMTQRLAEGPPQNRAEGLKEPQGGKTE